MPVDTSIPLGVRTLDTATPLMQFAQSRRQDKLDKAAEARSQKQDQLTDTQIASNKLNNLDARDQQRIKSSVIASAQLSPLLESGNIEGARRFLNQRKIQLQEMQNQGITIDTKETDEALQMLDTDVEKLKQITAGGVRLGTQLGIFQGNSGGSVPAAIQVQERIDQLRRSGNEESASLLERTAKINPKGYFSNPVTGGLEIDPSFLQGQGDLEEAKAAGRKQGKGLTPKTQEAQDTLIDEVALGTSIATDLSSFVNQIDSGELNLNFIANAEGLFRNNLNMSNEQSRSLQSFKSFVNKLRNDSLRLNKGVQTEGDAQRALDELIANINDPNVVKKRLRELETINKRASAIKEERIQLLRKENGQDPLDLKKIIGAATQPAFSSQEANTSQNNEIKILGFE